MNLLFYDDAPEFGGHEQMTLVAVRHLAMQPDVRVGFIFYRANKALEKHLEEIRRDCPELELIPRDYVSIRRQAFRTLMSLPAAIRLSAELRKLRPDLLIVAQGGIAVSSIALVAGRMAGIRTVSYIPMTHPEAAYTSSRWKAALREITSRLYYSLPDHIFTISERMKRHVTDRGIATPVTVIPNGIDFTSYTSCNRGEARRKLSLADGEIAIIMVGRIEFWQKRHDIGFRAFAMAHAANPALRLFIIGDGPDRMALADEVAGSGCASAVAFLPWTNDIAAIYAAADVVLLPSRYEGVPLVMIEAMYLRLPVIASDVDGMADALPPAWLAPQGDPALLAKRLVDVIANDQGDILARNHSTVTEHNTQAEFCRRFGSAITAVCTDISASIEPNQRSTPKPEAKT